MRRDRTAAVGRHPVLSPHGRSYHDRLLVEDLGGTTNVRCHFGEEVASEPWGKVEARLHAMLEILGNVLEVIEPRIEEDEGHPTASNLFGRLSAHVTEQGRVGGD